MALFDDQPLALSIDCETLSLDPRAHILQVGFCTVDLVKGDVIHPPVNVWLSPVGQQGRAIDPETVYWWLTQKTEIRRAVWNPPEGYPYHTAQELFDLLKHNLTGLDAPVGVWMRGNKDLIWLETLWDGKTPWHYRQAADMRSFVRAFDPQGVLEPSENESKHDGAADAMYQAHYLMNIVSHLRRMEKDAELFRAQRKQELV